MDKSFRRQKSGTQQSSDLFVSPQIFDGILKWLVGLIQLTEEEQRDAGIYLDDEYFK